MDMRLQLATHARNWLFQSRMFCPAIVSQLKLTQDAPQLGVIMNVARIQVIPYGAFKQ